MISIEYFHLKEKKMKQKKLRIRLKNDAVCFFIILSSRHFLDLKDL